MKEYTVKRMDSPDWKRAEKQAIEGCSWSPNPAPAATVQVIMLHEGSLCFRLESAAAPSRAVNTEPDSRVWEDSCLECFFSFDDKNYVNCEVNANAALRASYGAGRHERKHLLVLGVPMPEVKAGAGESGWWVELKLPAATVERLWGCKVEETEFFRANFYSCGDLTPSPHYASWSPVLTDTPDFHRPEYFGRLIISQG